MNITLEQVRIKDHISCGDSACCFMPPEAYLNLCDSSVNVVFELYNYGEEKSLEYRFGDGICPDLDFRLNIVKEKEGYFLDVLGRCRTQKLWYNNKICQNFPKNTDDGVCDYVKCLATPKKQLKLNDYFFLMYYAFRLDEKNILQEYCANRETYRALMYIFNDFHDKRVKKMLIKGESWGLIRIPRDKKVCSHLLKQ